MMWSAFGVGRQHDFTCCAFVIISPKSKTVGLEEINNAATVVQRAREELPVASIDNAAIADKQVSFKNI